MTEILKITLQFPSLRAFLAEYGERVSVDGMLLHGAAPPAAGSTVDIEVVVADGMRLLRARGETLWSGAEGTGSRQKAAAVRFQELDEASRTLIGKIVDQRRREGAEPFSLDDVPVPREARPRDLTVPAAVTPGESAAPVGTAVDSVFDLQEPPAAAVADLFSSLGPDEAAPAPPVASEEPAPLDLGPDVVSGEDEGEPGPAAQPDLSDLFGGDEPGMAPRPGRTEAFPPSFVDEVEAELAAARTPASPSPEVDTDWLEAQLGTPSDEPELDPEPEPESEPELEEVGQKSEPEPPLDLDPPPLPEALLEVARAFNAEGSSETVEIPIVESPPQAASQPVEEAPFVEEPPPAEEPPSAEEPPQAVDPPPVVEDSPPAAEPLQSQVDDNLLSTAGLNLDSAAVEMPEAPESQGDLASSAELLRGSASRSRHIGTWLLIALLVGAVGVAGYFLVGLVWGGGGEAEPDVPVTAPAPPPAAAMPETTPPEQAPVEAAATPGGEEATVAEEPAAVVSEQPEPAAPFAGLNRITWSETDTETILALVGDGAIPREQIEYASIGGAQPRLVIKILGVQRAFQPAVLEVGTSHVNRVRSGLQAGGELHVVVDLAVSGVSVRDLAVRGSRVELRLGVE